MKQSAVVIALALVAATAATVVMHHSRAHDASRARAEAKRTRPVLPLERRPDEQPLVHAPSSSEPASSGQPRGLVLDVSLDEKRAEHDAAIDAGNAIIDRAIQGGQWRSIDYARFNAATYMLSGEEQADMLARISGAITRGEVEFEMR